jgi:hypothetical protein
VPATCRSRSRPFAQTAGLQKFSRWRQPPPGPGIARAQAPRPHPRLHPRHRPRTAQCSQAPPPFGAKGRIQAEVETRAEFSAPCARRGRCAADWPNASIGRRWPVAPPPALPCGAVLAFAQLHRHGDARFPASRSWRREETLFPIPRSPDKTSTRRPARRRRRRQEEACQAARSRRGQARHRSRRAFEDLLAMEDDYRRTCRSSSHDRGRRIAVPVRSGVGARNRRGCKRRRARRAIAGVARAPSAARAVEEGQCDGARSMRIRALLFRTRGPARSSHEATL